MTGVVSFKGGFNIHIGHFDLRRANAKSAFTPKERIAFYEILTYYLEDKNTVLDAIREQSISYAARKHPLATMFRIWADQLSNGVKLSDAMGGWVPSSELAFIRVGENSKDGDMSTPLKELIPLLEMQRESMSRIKMLFFEPSARLAIFILALFGLSYALIPKLVDSLNMPLDQYPGFTRGFYKFALWFGHGGFLIIPALLAVFGLAFWALPRYTGAWRKRLDRYPPFSTYQTIKGAFFLIVVSGMIRAQISINEGVMSLLQDASPWETFHYRRMLRRTRDGFPEAEAVDTGYLPMLMADEVARYAARSNFERAFARIGRQGIKNLISRMDVIGKVLSFLSMLLLFVLIVAFLASTFYLVQGIQSAANASSAGIGH